MEPGEVSLLLGRHRELGISCVEPTCTEAPKHHVPEPPVQVAVGSANASAPREPRAAASPAV